MFKDCYIALKDEIKMRIDSGNRGPLAFAARTNRVTFKYALRQCHSVLLIKFFNEDMVPDSNSNQNQN